jgi:hypothetical protein
LDHAVYKVHPLPFKPSRFSDAHPCEKQNDKEWLPKIIQDLDKAPDFIKREGFGWPALGLSNRVHVRKRI